MIIRIGSSGFALFVVASLLSAPGTARAAESYDNCTGFITSVPAIITTQGTWCLKQDLTTAMTSGIAITVGANNITIDCNDFKLGGLAAGAGTQTVGILANNRLNATIRHCNIRGFYAGIELEGTTGGNVVEDNRFDGNTYYGMFISGDGSVIRRNRVFDTGDTSLGFSGVTGIYAQFSVDVQDNVVSGVTATAASNGSANGIYTDFNSTGRITGNSVNNLVKDGSGSAFGIYDLDSGSIQIRDNDVNGDGGPGSIGIRCTDTSGRARDNQIGTFGTGISNCTNVSGNDFF